MKPEIIRLNILVKGKVQGVGYRYFVMQKANEMGITGWVRNLNTGDVDMEIQGEKDKVIKMSEQLLTGHSWAKVHDMNKTIISIVENEKKFELRY